MIFIVFLLEYLNRKGIEKINNDPMKSLWEVSLYWIKLPVMFVSGNLNNQTDWLADINNRPIAIN